MAVCSFTARTYIYILFEFNQEEMSFIIVINCAWNWEM